jgi:hypothetical protein
VSRSQSSAGSDGSSVLSNDRSFPVTFSRTLRASSWVSIQKYERKSSMSGRNGAELPYETETLSIICQRCVRCHLVGRGSIFGPRRPAAHRRQSCANLRREHCSLRVVSDTSAQVAGCARPRAITCSCSSSDYWSNRTICCVGTVEQQLSPHY